MAALRPLADGLYGILAIVRANPNSKPVDFECTSKFLVVQYKKLLHMAVSYSKKRNVRRQTT